MALATIFFWMGRREFAHIPPGGKAFIRESFGKEGLSVVGKLIPLVLFVGIFWCLFDQTASRLVFQAERMDRNIFSFEVLPSQIQAANPFLILVLIPFFTFLVYPFVEKRIPFTPLRKIGTGLAIMALAFVVVSYSQEAIDRGETPHVGWQLLAYLILTSAEVLVSIVALEFFYTQAPRKMKSLMMAIFLASVSVGNSFTALVNDWIQVGTPDETLARHQVVHDSKSYEKHLPGYDKVFGTEDDLYFDENRIDSSVSGLLSDVCLRIEHSFLKEGKLPSQLPNLPSDQWGTPLRYKLLSSKEARVSSNGPDKMEKTEWDLSVIIQIRPPEDEVEGTWLYEAKKAKGLIMDQPASEKTNKALELTYTAGGGETLEGANYFWFFTKLMIGTALVYIPFAILYKPRDYLHRED